MERLEIYSDTNVLILHHVYTISNQSRCLPISSSCAGVRTVIAFVFFPLSFKIERGTELYNAQVIIKILSEVFCGSLIGVPDHFRLHMNNLNSNRNVKNQRVPFCQGKQIEAKSIR